MFFQDDDPIIFQNTPLAPLYCQNISQESVGDSDKLRHKILQNNTWDPIWLNSGLLQDSTRCPREDVAEQYGQGYVNGDFYHTFTDIRYNKDVNAWQIDDILDSHNSSMSAPIPVNVIDKIKVYSCFFYVEGCSRLFLHNSAHNIQIETINSNFKDDDPYRLKKPLNIFLQEVNKCAETRATITRYKLSEPCLGLYPICLQNEKLCAININIPRGRSELYVTLQAMLAWYVTQNVDAKIELLFIKLNNNSVTIDSFFSCINDEVNFKNEAVKNNIILTKKSFHTHKYITEIPLPLYKQVNEIYHDPGHSPILAAATCQCKICRLNGHKKNNSFNATSSNLVSNIKEIQIYGRSLNCSGVSGFDLLPVLCDMINKFFNFSLYETPKIDLCLASMISHLEKQSSGLVPNHIRIVCELWCYKLKTHLMAPLDQISYYYKYCHSLITRIKLSRLNFAISSIFVQTSLKGDSLIVLHDCQLITPKYNKADIQLNKKRKRQDNNMTLNRFIYTTGITRLPRRNNSLIFWNQFNHWNLQHKIKKKK